MPVGAGKYDAEALVAHATTEGEIVIVLVVDGNRGNGFQLRCNPERIREVPELLRRLAREIEQTYAAVKPD